MSNDTTPIPVYIAETFNQVPIPISIYDRDGFCVAFNDAHGALWNIRREGWLGHFNMVTDPQLAATGAPERFKRVMNGEQVTVPPAHYDTGKSEISTSERVRHWVEAIYFPVRNTSGDVTHLGAILRDVTLEQEQRRAIEVAQAEILTHRNTIETLATPVVQIWQGILMVPLVGIIDNQRATHITESLLLAIAHYQAECVILDITGVPVVDTQVAQLFIQTARACALLGSDVALVGISGAMAQTLVHLGIDLNSLVTLANLQAGIAWAFAHQHLSIVPTNQNPTQERQTIRVG